MRVPFSVSNSLSAALFCSPVEFDPLLLGFWLTLHLSAYYVSIIVVCRVRGVRLYGAQSVSSPPNRLDVKGEALHVFREVAEGVLSGE